MTLLKVGKVTYNDHRKVTGRLQIRSNLDVPLGLLGSKVRISEL